MLNNITAIMGGGAAAVGNYESIQTVTLSSNATSINFTSIPSTYKHLQIRGIARSTRSNSNNNIYIGLNGDTTTANYNAHWLGGDGASASGNQLSGVTGMGSIYSINVAATSTANVFGGIVIDILDYANTNKYKTMRTLSGYDANGSGNVGLFSGLWLNTAAVTSINLLTYYDQYATYSSFALYGIK
jgi:hypothetical protein